MSKVLELYGHATHTPHTDWATLTRRQFCPYLERKCLKVRKSAPEQTIGTCVIQHGQKAPKAIVICPFRLLERGQIFLDNLHLLSLHEPGNELHVVPEVSLPGGNVDYFLVSVRGRKVVDFAGIELQALDTTGTVWPERQRFLRAQGIAVSAEDAASTKPFGINWKMTAKTILVQLHHKLETLEALGKHLTLVIQDHFLAYMQDQFQFEHFTQARQGDALHIHAYRLDKHPQSWKLQLAARLSTDTNGLASALGLQANPRLELEAITRQLEAKISAETLLRPIR